MTPNSLERHFGLLSLPCFLHFHVGRQGTSQERFRFGGVYYKKDTESDSHPAVGIHHDWKGTPPINSINKQWWGQHYSHRKT